jgi:hypothetical protein
MNEGSQKTSPTSSCKPACATNYIVSETIADRTAEVDSPFLGTHKYQIKYHNSFRPFGIQ